MRNRSALILLLSANAVSQFAQGISMIAIPWYFINHMKLPGFYNWVFLLTTLATFFWAPVAGTIIDRFPRKNIFRGLCLVGMIMLFCGAGSGYYYGNVPVAMMVAVFAFTVLNYNIHYPSLYALSQEISEGGFYAQVNSYLEVQGQATSMLSGAAAAILISGYDSVWSLGGTDYAVVIRAWDLQDIFLMDAITYCIAFALLSMLRYTPTETRNIDRGSFIRRLKNGFLYLKEHPLLFRFGLFSYFVFVAMIVHVFYVMHLYVSEHLQQDGSVLAGAQIGHTFGALSAGLLVRKLFQRVHATTGVLILMGLVVIGFFIAGNNRFIWVYWLVCMLLGYANSGIRIMRVTFLFEHVPNDTIGRVTSVFQSSNIMLRIGLIALFHQAFITHDPSLAYLISCAFVLVAMIPLLWGYKRITKRYPQQ